DGAPSCVHRLVLHARFGRRARSWRRADRDAGDRGRSAATLPRLQHVERSGARGDMGAGARRRNRRYPPATVGKIPAGALLLGADRAAAALRGLPALRSQAARPGAASGQLAGGDRGVTLILIPVIAICAASIVTLRSPEATKAFSCPDQGFR